MRLSFNPVPAIIGSLSLEEKVGQMLMIGFSGTSLPVDARNRLESGAAGFVALFHYNITSVDQVVALTNDVHACRRPSPMIWTDQEGGNVVQFKEIAATTLSAMGLAATGKRAMARRAGSIMGREMMSLGVDGVLAPVLDVNTRPDNPIIGFRAFSDDPVTVTRFGSALAGGLRTGGVATCGKHFPGHGDVGSDSHAGLPVCTAGADWIHGVHLAPFRALIRAGMLDAVMPAHVVYPEVDADMASMSSHWLIQVLRRQLGFRGLIISDCLEMGAVQSHMEVESAAVRAVRAGVDVLSVTQSAEAQSRVHRALVEAVRRGELPISRVDESLARILDCKRRRHCLAAPLKRDGGAAGKRVRSHYAQEFRMAAASITCVRDRDKVLPLDRRRGLLLVEWKKVVATEALSQAAARSVLESPLKRWFPSVDALMLELEPELPEDMAMRLKSAAVVVLAVFSRSPEIQEIQAAAVRKVLRLRPDALVVALGNPYDLRGFPNARTFLATYGYRRVQAEALAAVLAGEVKPRGRLPVKLFRD